MSWNGHLEYFLSGKIFSTYSNLFCFTEASINDSPSKHFDENLDGMPCHEYMTWLGSILQHDYGKHH